MRPSILPVLLLFAAVVSAPAEAGTRRFAIVVGHNAGAPHRAPLRYAESDAGKMARVLTELAEVAPPDTFLLQGRTVLELETALARVSDAIRVAHASLERTVVYFYFSGHGERDAVELGRETLSHARLQALLEGTGADLRLSFIDACRSGGAVQERGARGVPAFEVALQDELRTRGHAVVTSSARDEVSLESAEVGGGYFTSHLVTGLRGAADVSADGQVTLAELYRYAHDRTVTSAATTSATAQHPTYQMSLSGQGELVLARLERASAILIIPEGATRVLVRDTVRDQLIAEWVAGSASNSVAVPPGPYSLLVATADQSYGGRLRLEEGERRAVKLEELRKVDVSSVAAASRGAPQLAPALAPPPSGSSDRLEFAVIGASVPGLGVMGRVGLETRNGHAITTAMVFGLEQGQTTVVTEVFDTQAYVLTARLGYRFLFSYERFGAWIGAEAAAGAMLETGLPFVQGGRQLRPVIGIGPRAGVYFEPTPYLRVGVVGDMLWGAPSQMVGIGFNVSLAR